MKKKPKHVKVVQINQTANPFFVNTRMDDITNN